ncbi:hypothetical protein Tco_0781300, partial [Tanacetum coccineum]
RNLRDYDDDGGGEEEEEARGSDYGFFSIQPSSTTEKYDNEGASSRKA